MIRPIVTTLAVALVWSMATAATFTVSKDGRGQFATITEAIAKAGKGDIVKILDNAVYAEQVDIDSTKAGLTLTSANPLSRNKPTIRWQDKDNVNPKTCAEAKDDASINFDRNGALRLLKTRNVTIDGIAIDGVEPYAYGWSGVWKGDQDCQYPLQLGNAAVAVWVSGGIVIRNCDISNAYMGIKVHGRNEGGIFGNPNPADLEPWNVVPLSGFGKAGSHLIEHNRIHHNSWGMFFESVWDLGSVIRYNVFYENHHPSDAFAANVKGLTSDGQHQPGGALWFKDHWISPLAIYNNTFWHNYLIFCGGWRPGGQHLVFNNIYAKPHRYWADDPNFQNPWHKIDHRFRYRMKHCVYASQSQAPSEYYVALMNDFQLDNVGGPIPQGTLITTPFPADADIRWLETTFKSTDPASPDFLTPDWDDPLVKQYIVDKGWPEAGITDADGSIADLGAIPMGGRVADVVRVTPLSPVVLKGTRASMTFDVTVEAGSFSNPRVGYIRYLNNIPLQKNSAFGGTFEEIDASDIHEVAIPQGTRIEEGSNSLTLTVPALDAGEIYAFFELVLIGTGSNGEEVHSSVGFMPYRKLDYGFDVTVLDITGTTEVDEVRAGDTVKVKIEARKADGSLFANTVKPVEVNLNSGADLLDHQGNPLTLPDGVSMAVTKPVVFTKVPGNGIEYVMASGLWNDPGTGNSLAFFGVSDGVRIRPGPPAKVVFQDPPSNSSGAAPPVIDPGFEYDCGVHVYDRFDNNVDQAVSLTLASSDATKGDIVGAQSITTDTTGVGTFAAAVTNGAQGDVFTLSASIDASRRDEADLQVGEPLDQLWIFYGDVGSYDSTAEIREQAGSRAKVTIWASTDGTTPLTGRTNTVSVTLLTPGLQAYATRTSTDPLTQVTLTRGAAEIWITANAVVKNGGIEVADASDNTLLASDYATRDNIFFTITPATIDSAFYYADNGTGAVDRVEIFYKEDLPAVPDSVLLYWPDKASGEKKVVRSGDGSMTLAGTRRVTVTLSSPFTGETTTGDGRGVSWDRPHPDVPAEPSDFAVRERVGPLLIEANVAERFAPGNDTFTVTFSEKVDVAAISGASFVLLKPGGSTVTLTVPGTAVDLGGATSIRFVVADAGADAPAAGDSLRILATGPVSDAAGTKAHEHNRPVPVRIVRKPVPVEAAWYVDGNVDGTVDRVVIDFAKPLVDLSAITASVSWVSDKLTGTDAGLTHAPGDGSLVIADITGIFPSTPENRTGGAMDLTVRYVAFDTSLTRAVADSAAPVIATARFAPGAVVDRTTSHPDTLRVSFSEDVAAISSTEPFDFFDEEGGTYGMTLRPLEHRGANYAFIVESIDGAEYPSSSDSISIDPDENVGDPGGIIQDNGANRPVPLSVKPRPYTLVFTAGPNPFVPGVSPIPLNIPGVTIRRGVVIQVDALTNLREQNATLDGTVAIYDAVGNLVGRCDGIDDKNARVQIGVEHDPRTRLYFFWSGRNEVGRTVGAGTYIAYIRITDSNGNQKEQTVRLGVNR